MLEKKHPACRRRFLTGDLTCLESQGVSLSNCVQVGLQILSRGYSEVKSQNVITNSIGKVFQHLLSTLNYVLTKRVLAAFSISDQNQTTEHFMLVFVPHTIATKSEGLSL